MGAGNPDPENEETQKIQVVVVVCRRCHYAEPMRSQNMHLLSKIDSTSGIHPDFVQSLLGGYNCKEGGQLGIREIVFMDVVL